MALQGWRERNPGGDVVRKHRPDHLIALYAGLLMLVGLILIYAIGPQRANVLNALYGYEYSENYFFIKQLISFLLSVGAFAVFSFFPYKVVMRFGMHLLVAGLIASGVLAVAGWLDLPIVQTTNGATRWFNLGPLGTLQPAEILKFGVLIYLAALLAKKRQEGKVNSWEETLMPVAVMSAVTLFIVIVVQKDLGTGVSLSAIIAAMLFIAGLRWKYIGVALVSVVVVGSLLVFTSPHRVERVMTFIQGDSAGDSDNGYHIRNAKIALGSGGFWGVGIGESVQASGYLPEAINDSIFAIFGEMFGFVGTAILVALFVALLMRLLGVIDKLVDFRLKLLVSGVFGWIAAHVILNIAAMIGLMPLTGITLPLLSYGGTSMIFMAAALGLVYQASRYTIHPSRIKEAHDEDSRSRRGVGRTRHTSRRGA